MVGPPRVQKVGDGQPTTSGVRTPNSAPEKVTSRPPEPVRPAPARRAATSLLALKARRRRFRLVPPAGR